MSTFGGFGAATPFANIGGNSGVPSLGGGFGSSNTSVTSTGSLGSFSGLSGANPSTGFGFGVPTSASTGTGFGFGGIGGTTTAPSLFTGLGLTNTAATTTSSAFSFAPIGTTTTAPAFSSGGALGGPFGTSAFNSSAFGTLNKGTSFGPSNTFGTGTTFGSGPFSTNTLGTGTFGSSSLGTGLGAPIGGSGSLFGVGASTSQLLFNQGTDSSPALTNLAAAVHCPMVFGDERDVILAKWNKLQAFWGIGKGIYSSNGQCMDFTADNPFCRFKAIGYSCIPTAKNKDGLFALAINRKSTDVIAQQQQLVENLHRVLGNRPTLSVCVEGVKPVSDNKTEIILYLLERAPTGASRRIPTSESFAFLSQTNIKSQLTGLGIEGLIPKSAPTKEQLQQYLDNPPIGIDPLLWQQAKLDNPDPEHLIPVPMIGFNELQLRLKYQEQETKQHQGRLDIIAEDIVELQRKHASALAKITELKRKQLDLGHRVLQVMVKQETTRKLGYAVQADEEQLRVQLETILAELSAPNQFKGRLNELMSQIRMQNQQTLTRSEERYAVDNNLQREIKQLLKQQQQGLIHLIDVIRQDLEDLRLIENGLKESVQRKL